MGAARDMAVEPMAVALVGSNDLAGQRVGIRAGVAE